METEEEKKAEAPVVKRCMLKASSMGSRLLRNNRGLFKTLDGKRKVRAGLEADGASDLVGITPVLITPAMVGMTLGVMLVAECKKPGWTAPQNEHEEEQANFIAQIRKLGGFGFFITNHEDLPVLIENELFSKLTKNPLDSDKI